MLWQWRTIRQRQAAGTLCRGPKQLEVLELRRAVQELTRKFERSITEAVMTAAQGAAAAPSPRTGVTTGKGIVITTLSSVLMPGIAVIRAAGPANRTHNRRETEPAGERRGRRRRYKSHEAIAGHRPWDENTIFGGYGRRRVRTPEDLGQEQCSC